MSMIGNFVRLSEPDLQRLLADPDKVPSFLMDAEEFEGPKRHLDVDKAWHLIHFLLTGSADEGSGPLANAVIGGQLLGNVDVGGYGPAVYLSAAEVAEVS